MMSRWMERVARAIWPRLQFVWWGNTRCDECGKRDWSYWWGLRHYGPWPDKRPILTARWSIGPLEIRVWKGVRP